MQAKSQKPNARRHSGRWDWMLDCYHRLNYKAVDILPFVLLHSTWEISMLDYMQRITEASEFLKERFDQVPDIGMLTGTGLGESAAAMDVFDAIGYEDIPYFPVSTVQSHYGRFLIGRIHHKTIGVCQGRFHLYEGYTPLEVTFPIRVLQQLGISTLFLTNAAGGLNPAFNTGDIMVVTDHINLTGDNPLLGPNEDQWGVRFPDMIHAYDPRLSEIAQSAGKASGIPLQKGVYAGLKGPSLETPAEVRFLRTIGADAVGFSTVQEVIAAVHAEIRVLGLSIITNVHNPEDPEPASVDEIIAVAGKAAPMLNKILQKVVETIE
jgi:purine-nucleoside phosphorylase